MGLQKRNLENLNNDEIINEYNEVLKELYDTVYSDNIKEIPMTAGQYIIVDRNEIGMIYQKLANFEKIFDIVKSNIIKENEEKASFIIEEAKMKSYAILDANVTDDNNELELVRNIKELAIENVLYIYKKLKNNNQKNIDELIEIDKNIKNNIKELDKYLK